MHRKILIKDQKVSYYLRKSRRAKRLRLTIYCDGGFVVTLPHRMNEGFVERFILEKADWVIEKLRKMRLSGPRRNRLLYRQNKAEYKQNKKRTYEFAMEKIKFFNEFYNFKFGKISIRNQRTRWGSCSRKGNLNFNYKIIFLPEKIANYIIVHELCHLKEFNHSRRFWDLVEKAVPDYKKIRKDIKKS